ncbi:hypothetical protein LG047_12620 [Methylocystis sp. WRRC1]|uniref:hypothetical protein n=1 Tax=unclassified Methylocystis TaxID=2625913 RepID=UPI0001F86860|nr:MULTISPECIES: hypothetical protein [unclassified Methylocystis]MCC3246153.1 hypothetical protein [Methylocystis sp. WRRC1]
MSHHYTLRERVERMVKAGMSDEEIIANVGAGRDRLGYARHCIQLSREAVEQGGGVNRRGPWPVSYVRNTGEKVFRVGPGHDIPEGSLKAFGFEATA